MVGISIAVNMSNRYDSVKKWHMRMVATSKTRDPMFDERVGIDGNIFFCILLWKLMVIG